MGKTLAEYQAEYTREPFRLPIDEKNVISFPQRTLGEIMGIEQAAGGSILETLVLLAGEQGEQLRGALLGSPPGVIMAIRDDAYIYWGTKN